MSPLAFLLAWSGLVVGTYVLRVLGVKFGAALAGSRDTAERDADRTAPLAASATTSNESGPTSNESGTGSVTAWLDRATVVLIAAVAATTAIFDGKHLADPTLIIGVGAGVLAAILKAPMLVCVIIGMAVCAGLRISGLI